MKPLLVCFFWFRAGWRIAKSRDHERLHHSDKPPSPNESEIGEHFGEPTVLKRLGIFEIGADISNQCNGRIVNPLEDVESQKLLASLGIKKTFKGEMFYQAITGDNFLYRTANFSLIGTIEDRIYKIYFKFLDDDRAACMSFRDEIRAYLAKKMPSQQFNNPQITKIENGCLSIWSCDWGNILVEEFGMLTERGAVWNTAIAATSNTVKTTKRIGFFNSFGK